MSTLGELTRANALTWTETERYVERLFDAVAARHARGSGGRCSPDVATVSAEAVGLPDEGPAGDDAQAVGEAKAAAWELLAGKAGSPEALLPVIRERWPEFSGEHLSVLERAGQPAALALAWSQVRRGAMQPLRLKGGARKAAVKTGVFSGADLPSSLTATRSLDSVREPEPPKAPESSRSWIPFVAVGAIVAFAGCAGLTIALGILAR